MLSPCLPLVNYVGYDLACIFYEATSFFLIAFHHNFCCALKFELPYTLFQIKAVLLEIAVQLSVLHPGFLCRQKLPSPSSGAGSGGRVTCLHGAPTVGAGFGVEMMPSLVLPGLSRCGTFTLQISWDKNDQRTMPEIVSPLKSVAGCDERKTL